jgi:lipopolysaccharide/colanic/teichoic acid biosynthesis glycosyltransferase
VSRRGRVLLLLTLLAADALAIVLAAGAAYWLAAQPAPLGFTHPLVLGLGLAAWLITFSTLRLYDLETVLEDSQEYATVATGCSYGILLLIVLVAVAGEGALSLTWLFLCWLLSILIVCADRFLMRRLVRATRRGGHLMARALIVGADEQGRAIARQLSSEADSGLRVLGFVDDFLPRGTPVSDGLSVLGHPNVLPKLVAEHRVAEIVVVPGAMAWESFQQILEEMSTPEQNGPRIRLSPGYYDLLATTPRVAHRNFVPLFVVDSARLTGFDALLKSLLDFGLGGLVLILSLPLDLVIVLSRAAAKSGQVFITEEYQGIGGRPFRARLFASQPGDWLAVTGLYRLPLLPAVLAGHMSLVGPRPITPADRVRYRRWMPSLASVKPGVTGPWSVVPVAALEEEMRAAMYYIRNWTIWLDLQVLAQTILVILRQRWGKLE